MNQNKVLFYLRLVISNDFGVLEYWSDGAMDKDLTSFFQYSNTPSLQLQYSMIQTFKTL